MSIDMSQFYQVFFDESGEHLAEMERLLLEIDVDNPDIEQLNAIFRSAHSIKGGSGTFGFTDMTSVTHILETLLDKLRKGEMAPTMGMIDAFLDATDVLKDQLNCHVNGTDAEKSSAEAICERLRQLTKGQETAGSAVVTPASAEPAPTAASLQEIPAQNAEEGEGYGFFVDIKPPAEASAPAAESAPAAKAPELTKRAGADKPAAAPTAAGGENSIRVSVEKVDQLINLVGELVITQAMLAQTASTLDPILYESLQNGLTQLERNTRDMQESVMSIRMMPISFVFSRFPRVVRDLAGKLNKQVEMVTVGENTELDKGLIERIADPLTHLVRNSLDHGIEMPEKRIAAGKNPKGTITLSASHQGGAIVIEVADDGAGLNREKILSKAMERGLDVSDAMTDQEVWQLVFAPGFSTADVVTDVSGRGVGMDVVIRNITEMGGQVEIDSEPGHGSKVTVRLPLTLAILDGMSVALGDSTFVVPLNMIVETFQPKQEDIKAVTGEGELVHIRGEYLPLLTLHKTFNMEPKYRDPTKGVLVMIEDKGKRAALFVDSLLGQQQVVIKSLESNYRKVSGISGATIMGDGKVAMILDVAALIKTGQAGF